MSSLPYSGTVGLLALRTRIAVQLAAKKKSYIISLTKLCAFSPLCAVARLKPSRQMVLFLKGKLLHGQAFSSAATHKS